MGQYEQNVQFGDMEFGMDIGVPAWNPAAKLGYDHNAYGLIDLPSENSKVQGITANAPHGLLELLTEELGPTATTIISTTIEKYGNKFNNIPYPVLVNLKGIIEEDLTDQKKVSEHEFTHRGLDLLNIALPARQREEEMVREIMREADPQLYEDLWKDPKYAHIAEEGILDLKKKATENAMYYKQKAKDRLEKRRLERFQRALGNAQ